MQRNNHNDPSNKESKITKAKINKETKKTNQQKVNLSKNNDSEDALVKENSNAGF